MATEIGALRASLSLDSAQFQTGIGKAQTQLVGMTTRTAQASRGVENLGKSVGAQRAAIQNFSFQIQDMAVQIGGGTSAMRAIGQQLPQMLSGFGLLGVALGTVVAVGFPLASALLGVDKAAQSLDKTLQPLRASLEDLKRINDTYSVKGIEGLIEKYGKLDTNIAQAVENQRKLFRDKAMAAAQETAAAIEDNLGPMTEILDRIKGIEESANLRGAALSALDLKDAYEELNKEFGITREQADAIMAALKQMNAPGATIADMAQAAGSLATNLGDSSFKGSDLLGQLLDSQDALLQLVHQTEGLEGWIGAAVNGASQLASQFWSAAKGAKAAADAAPRAAPPGQWKRSALNENMRGRGIVPESYALPDAPRHRGGGGGAKADPRAAYDSLMASLDPVIRATQDYKKALETVNAQYASGAISESEKARALELIKTRFDDATNSLQNGLGTWDSFAKLGAGAFDAIIEKGDSLKSVMKGILHDLQIVLIKQALLKFIPGGSADMSIGSLIMKGIGSVFGFSHGGAFDGGRLIPFAAGGIVGSPTVFPMRSGMGLMGEAGPEAIMPLTRGSGGKLGVVSQGRVAVGFDASAGDLTVAMYDAAGRVVEEARMGIIKQSVGAVQRGARSTKGFL